MNLKSILNAAKYVSANGLQNYLVFISTRSIDFISNDSDNIEMWGSTVMSQKSIKNPHILDIQTLHVFFKDDWRIYI